uniref:Uncharacterized protein n=1 Tax=Chinchilla lanigera TaxID=34839 RepID=A0A8C2VXU9_CHILA
MALQQAAKAPEHPSRLWIWDKVTFMDEQRRTWLPIILQFCGTEDILLEKVPNQE